MPRIAVNVNHKTKECNVEFEGEYIDLVAMIAVLIDEMAEEAKIDPLEVLYHLTNMYDIEEEE